ncbi:MAG: efflux RND transporter permease subunit [Saprospirales bacterium]|nr:MAG: efflux RND transporter permease subunit [Saprospirales bacterium]
MENLKKKFREFGLTSLAVDNATTILILTFMIFLFGIRSYQDIPKESFPEIPFPEIFVNTVYFGNSPADMENLVTIPLERELSGISEVRNITSNSIQDFSIIVVEFDVDTDRELAIRKVRDAIDRAKPELPTDLTEEPEIIDINLSDIPIMTVNVSGEYNLDELRVYADYLEERINRLREISDVDIKGDREREVKIDVDLHRMQAVRVTFDDIENAIRSENVTMSGGEMLVANVRRSVRVIGEFQSVDEIRDIIVKSEDQKPIYLRDIADVSFGYEDPISIARSDKLPVISLDVIKRAGENLLDASDKIKEIIEDAEERIFPSDLTVQVFNDQSVQTRDTVQNLENSIISGVILVILVLLFFLGIRNSLFVGIAIPLSMLMGIMIINMLGYTLNMVILFSLILALGLLVDNAIVVVENIYRFRQEGFSGVKAAKYGTGEVAFPIIASTATTLAAFLPLAFWPGLMGSFMKYMPITLIIVLTSSLFVALVINPVLTSLYMKVDKKAGDADTRARKKRNVLKGVLIMLLVAGMAHLVEINWLRNILVMASILSLLNIFLLRDATFIFQSKIIPFLELVYDKFIRFALRRFMPLVVFFGTVGLLVFAVGLLIVHSPKVEFFPETQPSFVNVFVELPLGTDIMVTDELVHDLEDRIMTTIEPHRDVVEAVLAQIGQNTADPNSGPDFDSSPQRARITVSFVPSTKRIGVNTYDIMDEIRESISGIPGVEITVDRNNDGPPVGRPINIEVRGEDLIELAETAEDMRVFINNQQIGGIEELRTDLELGKPEAIINIDREAARRFEVSTFAIADAMRSAIFGKEVTNFKIGEDEYPIMIRLSEQYRYNMADLMNQQITFRSASTGRISSVPVSAVANVSYSSTYNSVNRKNEERVITIFSNVLEGYNANEVVSRIRSSLENYDMPEHLSYEFTGEQEEQAENLEFLNTAFLVALFLIFLIIVSQFNSLITPFIIILSVVFSTIGVFLGYVVNNVDIVIIMTGVGIISLAGIVVNNAIVLIDYINLLIRRKCMDKGVDNIYQLTIEEVRECIIKGGSIRLRPVLLTAITTVLGLIPLAIGFNFNFLNFVTDLDPNFYIGGDSVEFWGVMAWTVIYGLMFATFLTLIVVPSMYWMGYRGVLIYRNLKDKLTGNEGEQ